MTARSAHPALIALGAVGAVGVAAATWGIGIERYLFTVRTATVPVLSPGSDPIRVLHLSDAHMAPWQHRKQQWLASLAALEPDLVVNTGDNLGHVDGLTGIRRAFAPLAGIPGVFVHGSNDVHVPSPRNPFKYFMGPSKRHAKAPLLDTAAMDDFFTDELGWTDLNNAAARLTVAGQNVDFIGVDDPHRDWDRLDELPEQIAGLGPREPGASVLAVAHAPYQRVLNEFIDLSAGMLIAGHTHGGQVCLPGYGTIVANCDIPLKQAKGLSTWSHGGRSVPLNVSAGCGTSIYAPVRFACRPEASLLTLVSAPPRFGNSAGSM